MVHDIIFGFAGGLLLGLMAAMLLLLEGRMLGISGILGGALLRVPDAAWRWVFVAGLVVSGLVIGMWHPEQFVIGVERSLPANIVAGVLIGVGTQIGNGCTSGHGICGIGRLSKRSIAATLTFIGTGAITVFVVAQLLGGRI